MDIKGFFVITAIVVSMILIPAGIVAGFIIMLVRKVRELRKQYRNNLADPTPTNAAPVAYTVIGKPEKIENQYSIQLYSGDIVLMTIPNTVKITIGSSEKFTVISGNWWYIGMNNNPEHCKPWYEIKLPFGKGVPTTLQFAVLSGYTLNLSTNKPVSYRIANVDFHGVPPTTTSELHDVFTALIEATK
jgi:hypothetical protein